MQSRADPRVQPTMLTPAIAPAIDPDVEETDDLRQAPLYRVLIHNDDVTPYNYVVRMLVRVFLLSEELADHIAWTAHHEEIAVVVVRPRPEAEKLTTVAHAHARMDGFPLTFSLEPNE